MNLIKLIESTIETGRHGLLPVCTDNYLYMAIGDYGYPCPILRVYNKNSLVAIDDQEWAQYGIYQIIAVSDSLILTKRRRSAGIVVDHVSFNGTALSVVYSWAFSTKNSSTGMDYYDNFFYVLDVNDIVSVDIINHTTNVEYTLPSTSYSGGSISIKNGVLFATKKDDTNNLFYAFTINADHTLSYVMNATTEVYMNPQYIDDNYNIYSMDLVTNSKILYSYTGSSLTKTGNIISDPNGLYNGALYSGVNYTNRYLTYIDSTTITLFNFEGLNQRLLKDMWSSPLDAVRSTIDTNSKYLYVVYYNSRYIQKYLIFEGNDSMTVDFST